jgi:hypothetical protein
MKSMASETLSTGTMGRIGPKISLRREHVKLGLVGKGRFGRTPLAEHRQIELPQQPSARTLSSRPLYHRN